MDEDPLNWNVEFYIITETTRDVYDQHIFSWYNPPTIFLNRMENRQLKIYVFKSWTNKSLMFLTPVNKVVFSKQRPLNRNMVFHLITTTEMLKTPFINGHGQSWFIPKSKNYQREHKSKILDVSNPILSLMFIYLSKMWILKCQVT